LAEVADGETHHLVATFDGATGVKSVFLDGQLIGSVDLGDDLQLLSGGAAEAFIGATGGQEPFTGLLDEVAIYNTALTQSEIAMHIQNVLSGAPNYFNAVPEPTSVTLLAISMALLAISTRRRK
jgi:hypothetical protein